MAATVAFKNIRNLQIGGRGRVPVRVFRTEHAHKVQRPTFFEVRMLRTENSYSQSSSSSDLKVPITKIKSAFPGIELPVFLCQISYSIVLGLIIWLSVFRTVISFVIARQIKISLPDNNEIISVFGSFSRSSPSFLQAFGSHFVCNVPYNIN